ncbi:MAG: hypothetical protein K1X78_16330 [Verrucomicrobiaceae bacterium]|nr:hypothetical protein [Verrucomicrobiaceae bacterium]
MRTLILLILLAAIGCVLDREQRGGRFQRADDLFLDFLVANARERFEAVGGGASDQVVFVRMREEDRAEYASWPPAPLDWQMVLKGLARFEPDVVVIATPLTWGLPAPEFVSQAGQALLPFPSVVMAVTGRTDTGETAGNVASAGAAAVLKENMPAIAHLDGEAGLLPLLQEITALPDEGVRSQMELGIVVAPADDPKTQQQPLLVRCGDFVAPSLVLQALARHSRTPYAHQRFRIGAGAGAHLGGGIFVPLQNDGSLAVRPSTAVASVNALDFIAGDLAESLNAADKAKLGRNKIIVVGIDNDSPHPSSARMQAGALAAVLALPRIHAIGQIERWIVCAIAAVLGCLLLRHRGGKAFRSGLLLIFAALVASFLIFRSQLMWFPPAVPSALLAASTLFAMLFGRKPSSAA